MSAIHSEQSSLREKLIEHLFIGEILKHAWQSQIFDIEVLKSEVDNGGYDVVLESNGIIRHIQLKTSAHGAKTAQQKLHLRLADKPAGCCIWIYFDPKSLTLGPFLYFGGESANSPLPSLEDARIARHTKGNQDGLKAERPNIRIVPKGRFQCCDSIQELFNRLFVI